MSKSRVENLSSETVGKKKEHSLSRAATAALLTGVILIGGTGCSGDKVGAQAPEVKPSTTTESVAEPTETETVENYTDQFLDEMEIYKEMSVEEFEALPREERLKYAQFLIDQTIERGNYEKSYGSGSRGADYYIDLEDLSVDSSGQDILNNSNLNIQLSFLQFVESDYENKSFDNIDGQKMLSSIYYNVGDGVSIPKGYFSAKDIMSTLEIPSVLTSNKVGVVSETSGVKVGIDLEGSQVQYQDIFYNRVEDNEPRAIRFVYTEFKNYNGESQSIWLIETMTDSQDDLSRDSGIK